LDLTVAKSVEKFFSSEELARYKSAKQVQGTMFERVSFVSTVGTATVLIGFLMSVYGLLYAWRRRQWTVLALIAMIWIGVLANAFATGGLSKPPYRYQTRIAWLLVLPPLLLGPRRKKSDSAIQSRSD
jgi:peptidoglycan/LPS O-acetylase OafA/YrhL